MKNIYFKTIFKYTYNDKFNILLVNFNFFFSLWASLAHYEPTYMEFGQNKLS